MKFRRGFTLVELLVVIGIIALLISILLPALSSARKQAAKVKCAASMRDIGNAFQMYVQENNGWAPPAKLVGGLYTLSTGTFDGGATPPQSAYWFNMLAKYLTKTSVGFAAQNGNDVNISQKSIFWGCPAWSGYTYNGPNNPLNVSTQSGYGMNGFPEYTGSFPPLQQTLGEPGAYVGLVNTPTYDATNKTWAPPSTGKWYKWNQYTRSSERALLGDCLFWFMESKAPLFPPPKMAGQYTLTNNATWCTNSIDSAAESTFDFYRHGTYPGLKPGTTDEFNPVGGKVAFNVLYCDGHVATSTDKADAYKVVRMRYPG